jgi:hypothetical protein
MKEIIIKNGIKVYKHHYCHCGCGERIPVSKSSIKLGEIPKNRPGHNGFKGQYDYTFHNLSKEDYKIIKQNNYATGNERSIRIAEIVREYERGKNARKI